MHRILPDRPHPLFNTPATRRIETAAAQGLPPHTLMERAGRSAARLALALAPHARHVWIACGPGHNGGDGLEAAAVLRQARRRVTVTLAADVDRLPTDARVALDRARAAGVVFDEGPPDGLGPQDLCIDALLGIGLRSRPAPMADHLQRAFAHLADTRAPILSLDIPSGLGADTGHDAIEIIAGGAAHSGAEGHFRSQNTLTFLTLKPGLFTAQGRDRAGIVWFDDLGIAPSEAPAAWLSGPPAAADGRHAVHKGSFGDVAVIGGEGIGRRGRGMEGAAWLAATAALHAGAGRVLLALLDPATAWTGGSSPELMLRTVDALDLSAGAVVCGCGGGEAIRESLPRVLAEASRLVLDADALNAVAADRSLQQQLAGRAAHGRTTVLTPHPLEAARLLDRTTEAVQADRLDAARRLSERYGCTVALKGSGTIVAPPGRKPAINPTGNGRLATAGTGDVLAGMVGAALARPGADAFQATVEAVYTHGALADRWPTDRALTAGRLARSAVRR